MAHNPGTPMVTSISGPLMLRLLPLLILLLIAAGLRAGSEGGWARFFAGDLRPVDERRGEVLGELDGLPQARFRPGSWQVGYRSEPAASADAEKWVQIDLGREYPVDDIVLVPAWLRFGDFPGPGFGFPVRFRVEMANDEKFTDPVMAADFTAADAVNPGLAPVAVRAGGKPARYVRVTATKLWRRIDDYVFALGELLVVSGNRNRAWKREVKAPDSFESQGMWSLRFLTDDVSVLGNPTDLQMLPNNGHHSELCRGPDFTRWVTVDLGKTVPVDEVRLIPARPTDYPDTIGFGFPLRFLLEGADSPDFAAPVVLANHTAENFQNPGDRPVVIPGGGKSMRYVRLTGTRMWQRDEETWVMALAEMQVMSGGKNAAAGQAVRASDAVDSLNWQPQFLVDEIAPRPGLGNIAHWLTALAKRQALETELAVLELRRAELLSLAEQRLLWSTGGTVFAIAGIAMMLHGRARRKHHREARRLRQDIAQDLHDEVGSNLGSIGILSQMVLDAAPEGEAVRSDVEEIHRVARETAESMRDIVWLISPGEKSAGDLADRLQATASSMLAGMEWKLTAEGLRYPLPLKSQRDVLLILKEALHNIRRHASATRTDIRLTESGGEFRMAISDNGRGFDPAAASGQGLANMQRRAQRMRGRLELNTATGSGTHLRLILPLSTK